MGEAAGCGAWASPRVFRVVLSEFREEGVAAVVSVFCGFSVGVRVSGVGWGLDGGRGVDLRCNCFRRSCDLASWCPSILQVFSNLGQKWTRGKQKGSNG